MSIFYGLVHLRCSFLCSFSLYLTKKSARFVPSAFLRRYNQIYPEKTLRLFDVLVLMLAVRRE